MPADTDFMPSDDEWTALTASDRKRRAYTEDLYFRACWADAVAVLGADATRVLGEVAMFAFKSDGVAGRRMRPTMTFLAQQGFSVLGAAPFRHNRHSMRAIWQYDWHPYSNDRLALTSVMHGATESLLLMLRDLRYDGVVPGTMRLSELKGAATDKVWTQDQLRGVLKPPNRVINFVHIADEPADTVRELAIFFDRETRRRLLEQVRDNFDEDRPALAEVEIDRIEKLYPGTDFDLTRALDRLRASGALTGDAAERLRATAEAPGKLSWTELCHLIDHRDPRVDIWDFVRVATEVLPMERPGHTGLMPAPTSGDWQARAAGRAR
ncbi:hypothetical protein [Micromonospora cathayae]|uniref:Nucleoside diphosphate kinase n=1 Tax=Micromonospora cathayae TaxID=3028804 RepID=A0ABY7ZTW6_9ACTN|nr:hypothetical protein [Micromonospora sp. HUAS 3]WDZ85841.1 hypothetical protein PVK37_05245 [Micromonospora sp. HUAS 3]